MQHLKGINWTRFRAVSRWTQHVSGATSVLPMAPLWSHSSGQVKKSFEGVFERVEGQSNSCAALRHKEHIVAVLLLHDANYGME